MNWKALTDADREAVVASLPGAIDGFLKGWGWQQFAQAIEDKCREKNEHPLDPCPFCGGEAAFGTIRYSEKTVNEQTWDQDTFHKVNCIVCGANNLGIVGWKTPALAAEHWNRRAENGEGAAR